MLARLFSGPSMFTRTITASVSKTASVEPSVHAQLPSLGRVSPFAFLPNLLLRNCQHGLALFSSPKMTSTAVASPSSTLEAVARFLNRQTNRRIEAAKLSTRASNSGLKWSNVSLHAQDNIHFLRHK